MLPDHDIVKIMAKAKQKMVRVYLKQPYKVLSIVDLKQRDKEKENASSPLKFFRAENHLKLHTVLRSTFQGDKDQKEPN